MAGGLFADWGRPSLWLSNVAGATASHDDDVYWEASNTRKADTPIKKLHWNSSREPIFAPVLHGWRDEANGFYNALNIGTSLSSECADNDDHDGINPDIEAKLRMLLGCKGEFVTKDFADCVKWTAWAISPLSIQSPPIPRFIWFRV